MALRDRWEALQARLRQPVETVTRNVRLNISGANVDEIDPPDDIDQYHEQYEQTGPVRKNIDTFVSDVVEPGVRVEADSDTTQAYFMGGDGAPDETPEGGFLENCFVLGGQRHQEFYPGLKTTITQRWTRGTVMVEYLKSETENPDSPITGFSHIRPETVTPQVEPYTNILIDPDAEIANGIKETERGEAAAYIQFDDNSILGRRIGGFDDDSEIALSQNDVLKQTLDPGIGGQDNEDGIFGTSIIEAITTDIKEYHEIKRDRATAIKTKAYGLWDASFNKETHDLGGQIEVTEWDEDSQDDWINEVGSIGPGDIVGHDGSIELQRFPSEVPELDGVLEHYIDDITAPLPAPKYAVGFEQNINQFISQQQENRYEKLIKEERRYQEQSWTGAFKLVAERLGLDTSGLKVVIEPEEEESPVRSLDQDDLDRLRTYTQSVKDLYGSGSAPSFIDEETLRELVLQLPEEADSPDPEPMPDMTIPETEAGDGEQQPPPETTDDQEQAQEQFAALMRGYNLNDD